MVLRFHTSNPDKTIITIAAHVDDAQVATNPDGSANYAVVPKHPEVRRMLDALPEVTMLHSPSSGKPPTQRHHETYFRHMKKPPTGLGMYDALLAFHDEYGASGLFHPDS